MPDELTRLWRDGFARRLDLAPFDRAQVRELVSARLDGPIDEFSAERLRSWTNGNALHITELVDGGLVSGRLRLHAGSWQWSGEPVAGDRLDELIRANLARVGDDLRPSLIALAVAEPASAQIMLDMTGEEPLRQLVGAGLAIRDESETGATYRLAHPLYRQPTLSLAGAADLTAARTAHVRALERHTSDRNDVRLLLAQLEVGAPVADTALIAAANRMMHADQLPLATRLVEHIANDARRAAAFGHLRVHETRPVDAARILSRVDLSALPPAEVDDTVCYHAHSLRFLSRLSDSAAVLAAAPIQSLRVIVRRGLVLHWAGADAEALSLCDAAVTLARANPGFDPMVEWEAISFMVPALIEVGQVRRAGELLGSVTALTQPRPWIHEWWMVVLCEPLLQVVEGRLHDALSNSKGLLQDALGFAHLYAAHIATYRRSQVLAAMGRYRQAGAAISEAIAIVDTKMPDYWRRGLCAHAAVDAAACGHMDEAQQWIAQMSDPMHGALDGEFTVREKFAAAFVLACRGSFSKAQRDLLALDDDCAGRSMTQTRVEILHLLARLGLAGEAAGRLRSLNLSESPVWGAYISHIHALAAGDGSDLMAVAEEFDELGMAHLAAEAYDAASAHVPSARAARGATSLRDACLTRCEAVPLPWWSTRTVPDLTSRQYEIAALAVNGLTSPEIAAQLYLSVRTVENHLQSVFTKLGVTNRSELRRALHRPHRSAR